MLIRDYMKLAVEEAKLSLISGDVPIGAIIVHQGEIIAKAHNQVEELKNPLAHAEITAINLASQFLSSKFLLDCDMYVTLEPCSMCAGAIVLSKIRRLYIGAEDEKTGACGSVYNIVQNYRLNHQTELYIGILKDECSKIITDFFEDLRAKKGKIKYR